MRKVAVLVDLITYGGVQKTAIEEVKNLKKMGYSVKLLVLTRSGHDKNWDLPKNIPIEFLSDHLPKLFQIGFKLPYFKFLSTQLLLSSSAAPFFIKKENWDLVISHGSVATLSALFLFYTKKIPYLFVLYDPMVYILEKVYKKTPLRYFFPFVIPLFFLLERKMVQNAKTCFVISNVHTNFIKSSYKIVPTTLYLGIHIPKRTVKDMGNKILFLGRFEKEKNIKVVFDLCKSLPHNKFIVAGKWTSIKDLIWFKSEIKKRNIIDRIELVESYQESDLPKIFEQSLCWVSPNFEAFSLSALEAASYGLPIVINKGSGVTELFLNSKHGFFPKNKNQLEKAVKYIAANARRAHQMGINAAKIIHGKDIQKFCPQKLKTRLRNKE